MTTEELQSACDAEPFEPFTLHLADGRGVPVHQPRLLVIFPNGRTVFVAQPDNSWNVIDLQLVTDMEFKVPTNGRSKRRAS